MTEQEKRTEKMQQNIADRQALESLYDEMQAESEALEKPELRHGDYGLDVDGHECMAIEISDKGMRQCNEHHAWGNCNDPDFRPDTILGNIFDDLKELAKPLEKIRIDKGNRVVHVDYADGHFKLFVMNKDHDSFCAIFNRDEFLDFSMQSRRMILTAEAK